MKLFDVINQYGYDIFYLENFKTDTKTQEIETSKEMTNWKKMMNVYPLPK